LDPRTIKYLVEALEDESYSVREVAVETLAKLRDRKVTPFLIAQLGSPREDYVEKVVTALGELGDARAEGPISKLTRHKNPKIRGLAAIALGSLAFSEEVPT
jgi:HEAT repeat protein